MFETFFFLFEIEKNRGGRGEGWRQSLFAQEEAMVSPCPLPLFLALSSPPAHHCPLPALPHDHHCHPQMQKVQGVCVWVRGKRELVCEEKEKGKGKGKGNRKSLFPHVALPVSVTLQACLSAGVVGTTPTNCLPTCPETACLCYVPA